MWKLVFCQLVYFLVQTVAKLGVNVLRKVILLLPAFNSVVVKELEEVQFLKKNLDCSYLSTNISKSGVIFNFWCWELGHIEVNEVLPTESFFGTFQGVNTFLTVQ